MTLPPAIRAAYNLAQMRSEAPYQIDRADELLAQWRAGLITELECVIGLRNI